MSTVQLEGKIMYLNPSYVEKDSRSALGKQEYSDSTWAGLFKSKMVDIGVATKESYIAVIDHAQASLALSVKEFRLLNVLQPSLIELQASSKYEQQGIDFIKSLSTLDGQYPEPEVDLLNFYAVEIKQPKTFWDERIVEGISEKYGTGHYIYFDAVAPVGITVVVSPDEPNHVEVAQFLNQQIPWAEGYV